MPVSLPTSADVRKARAQATKVVNSQFDVVRTPLLAWVGAGDLAVTRVTEAVDKARSRAGERRAEATKRAERLQAQVRDLPTELRESFTADELRKRYEGVTGRVRKAYTELADRGEVAVDKILERPRVKKVLDSVSEANSELGKRVEKAVDELHDRGEEVLGRVSTQTRSVGEKAARATQELTAEVAGTVTGAAGDFAESVTEAGAETAHTTRSVSRKAANKAAPKKPAAKRTNAAGTE